MKVMERVPITMRYDVYNKRTNEFCQQQKDVL